MIREFHQDCAHPFAASLALALQDGLLNGQHEDMAKLTNDFIQAQPVVNVTVIDASGNLLAQACRPWQMHLAADRGSVAAQKWFTQASDDSMLRLARPVMSRDGPQNPMLLGAVRITVDARLDNEAPAPVKWRTALLAAAVMAVSLPLAAMLVWRVLL